MLYVCVYYTYIHIILYTHVYIHTLFAGHKIRISIKKISRYKR